MPHDVGFRGGAQMFRIGGQDLYLLSLLTGPTLPFLNAMDARQSDTGMHAISGLVKLRQEDRSKNQESLPTGENKQDFLVVGS